MNLSSTAQIAWSALKAKKLRSFLTILGVVIGISAVIIVISAGEGVKGLIMGQLETFGTDWIEVEVKVPNTAHVSAENAMGMAMGVSITTLKDEDRLAIIKHPNVEASYSGVMGQEIASSGRENKQVMLFGTTEDFLDIDQGRLESGRYFSASENKGAGQVAVLGSAVKKEFFGESEAIGQSLKIGRGKYEVIGVFEERGSSFGMSFDDIIYVPLRTLQKKIMGIEHIMYILIGMKDPKLAEQTAADIREIMRERHEITDPDKDDFAVISMQESLAMMDVVINAIRILLVVIAGISLIVGGVGIMNIMYVNVNERTSEIGLRKAVGASRQDILRQFLMEAIFVTFIGGVLGILIGISLSYIIAFGARQQGLPWDFVVKWYSIVLACGFSGLVGLVFGLYPARKAAEMDPIAALRWE